MNTIRPSSLLKSALLADAVVSGATGLLQLVATGSLAALLNLPLAGLAATGEFLVAYALLLLVLATRQSLWAGLVGFIVFGNGVWGLGCIALLLGGALSANALGVAFVLMQATAVAVFAGLEWRGLRCSLPAGAAARAATF